MTGTPAWSLDVPDGVIARPVEPSPDSAYAATTIHRGWLNDTAPVTAIVATLVEPGAHLRDVVRRLARQDGEEVDVPGAHGARRADTTVVVEDGLDAGENEEALTVVVARAAHRDTFVVLTVRTRPADGVQDEVDRLAASLRLH